jgi:hypothetical protein
MQFTIDYDPMKLENVSIESTLSDFDRSNYRISEGSIVVSWNTHEDHVIDTELFTINATSKVSGTVSELFTIGSDKLKAESYDSNGSIKVPQIKTRSEVLGFRLEQNTPNPFIDNTDVRFILEQDQNVEIAVSDVQGRVVKHLQSDFPKGNNTLKIHSTDLGGSGVYYLTLRTSTQSSTIKMVVIR